MNSVKILWCASESKVWHDFLDFEPESSKNRVLAGQSAAKLRCENIYFCVEVLAHTVPPVGEWKPTPTGSRFCGCSDSSAVPQMLSDNSKESRNGSSLIPHSIWTGNCLEILSGGSVSQENLVLLHHHWSKIAINIVCVTWLSRYQLQLRWMYQSIAVVVCGAVSKEHSTVFMIWRTYRRTTGWLRVEVWNGGFWGDTALQKT